MTTVALMAAIAFSTAAFCFCFAALRNVLTEPLSDTGVLAPPQVLRRIFAEEDWRYVAVNGSTGVRSQFVRERSRLAMAWLRESRAAMSALWTEHRAAAGTSEGLLPATEIGLGLRFSFFWAISIAVSILVLANQVFAVRRVWQTVAGAAHVVDSLNASLRLQLVPQTTL